MPDTVAAHLAALDDAGFVLPAVAGGHGASLADVLPSVAAALAAGLDREWSTPSDGGRADPGRVPGEDRGLGVLPGRRVCVVLVDGLGYENLAERGGHAPTMRRALPDGRRLTTTFPSTTTAAIGAFGTGAFPGRTGMLGYTVRNPATGGLGNLVQWTGMPDPADWQRVPSVFERLVAAGVPVTSVGPARFAGSGMTNASLRGGDYVAAESWSGRVDAALRTLRDDGLVYLYWGDVDKVGHHHGWTSWQWGDELEAFDAELSRLVRLAPRGSQVVLTADHGMVEVDRALRWDVAEVPALAEGVALVGGEPRATHVYLEPGRSPQEAAARWREVLGQAAVVLTRDQVTGLGLLGPVSEHVLPATGDLVVAMTGRATVVDSRTQTPASLELVGVHGSLTPTEMSVPLLRWEA